ncbi:MAG: hypothetical protein KDC38_12115, partial [Planctomycetes bacterium]|nr:hypothetical protein [Planctomycetota bacterium]
TDRMIDGRGVLFEHEVDGMGNTIRQTNGLGETRFTYDESRHRTSMTRPNGWRTTYEYDDAGQLVATREFTPSGVLYATESREYEGPGGRLSRFVDAEGRERFYDYDATGRLIRRVDDAGGEVLYSYEDPSHPGLVTRIDRATSSLLLAYDAHGNLAEVMDPLGRVTLFGCDPLTGMPVTATTPEGRTIATTYDAENRIVAMTGGPDGDVTFDYTDPSCGCATDILRAVGLPGGETLQFTHDGLGRRTAAIDPLGEVQLFDYDEEGYLIEVRNRADEVLTIQRDAKGRITSRSDEVGHLELFAYDALDRLTSAANNRSLVEIERDFLGRATSVETTIDLSESVTLPPIVHTVDYTYDKVGKRLTLSDAEGVHSYGYDGLDRLISRNEPDGDSWQFGYDALGRLVAILRPNGVDTALTYDVASQLQAIHHLSAGGAALIAHDYLTYDLDGALTEEGLLSGTSAATWTYEYDDRQRLDRVTSDVSFGDTTIPVGSSHDGANRLLSDTEYTYEHDADGRMTARVAGPVRDEYDYDVQGRLVALRQVRSVAGTPTVLLDVQYDYDALGRRIARTVNGVRSFFLYDEDRILEELDGRGVSRRRFVHGLGSDEPLAYHDRVTGERYYYHQDRLGSVRGLTDASGQVAQLYVYDAFGALVGELAPSIHQPFGYLGRERDRESGLIYLRARYYEPTIGRFLSEDPLGLLAGENFYAYVHNDPVNRIDPSGEQGFELPRWTLGVDLTLTLGEVPKPVDIPPPFPRLPEPWETEQPGGMGGILIDFCAGGICGTFGFGSGLPDFSDITKTRVGCGLRLSF